MEILEEVQNKLKEVEGGSGDRIEILEKRMALMKTKMSQNGFDIGSPDE